MEIISQIEDIFTKFLDTAILFLIAHRITTVYDVITLWNMTGFAAPSLSSSDPGGIPLKHLIFFLSSISISSDYLLLNQDIWSPLSKLLILILLKSCELWSVIENAI